MYIYIYIYIYTHLLYTTRIKKFLSLKNVLFKLKFFLSTNSTNSTEIFHKFQFITNYIHMTFAIMIEQKNYVSKLSVKGNKHFSLKNVKTAMMESMFGQSNKKRNWHKQLIQCFYC